MKFSLKNKRAVVTGGGSGIGKSIAKVFSGQGADVYILDIDEANALQTVQEIKQNGNSAKWVPCDVSSMNDVKKAFTQIVEETKGIIDILVNNAGIAHVGNIEGTPEEDFNRIFRVNVKGVYHCTYAAIAYMKKQKSGVILNLASVASSIGIPDRFAYSMSKGAVVAMTLSVARDYVSHNIRCNSISPGRVHTPFVDNFLAKNYPGKEKEMFEKLSKTQPIGRMGKPDEMADLVLYLCSDEASFITGSNYAIDGGFVSLKV
jgi:NAD(P)-dependent dehydrogenase (short-subunit alcohol dehydrogenase family)